MKSPQKYRLDTLMTERGLAETRSQAQRLVMAGQVRIDGQVASKPSQFIKQDAVVEIEAPPRFISRGGEKLEGAFQAFKIDVTGKVCADVGASTGGFTDCLLQHGAERVYTIDVGHGILHWKLRNHSKVVVMERTNARYVTKLPEPVSLVTVDASFISLKVLLPVIRGWFGDQAGQVIALIKPQFEAGRKQVDRGEGVISDPQVHRQVLLDVLNFAASEGYGVLGAAVSPLRGPKGNLEFLAQMVYPGENITSIDELVTSIMLHE